MSLTDNVVRIALDRIKINRDQRQRKVINTAGLKESIAQRGVMNPIIITKDFELVAGERRLQSSIELGLPDIICRFAEDLSAIERNIIELEENLKRSDLTWRDEVAAIAKLHALYLEEHDQKWTKNKTAETIGLSPSVINRILRVAQDLDSPLIANAAGYGSAYETLIRKDDRVAQDAISSILEISGDAFASVEAIMRPTQTTAVSDKTENTITSVLAAPANKPKSTIIPADTSILHTSFAKWLESYNDRPFSFIHCDFPYGKNVFLGRQANNAGTKVYRDDPEIYWNLIKLLCGNLDKLMTYSGHMIFWFSMDYYHSTIEMFKNLAPSLDVQAFPLIWAKSDNVGVAPDNERQPRRIYETAFLISRGDAKLVKLVSNAYSAPTDKRYHSSTKPEPMLRHFFQLCVDEHTRMLDPTCGSGSALRAAESLGAAQVLGLELDEEHCENARIALRDFRLKNAAARKV